jgi:hypothetical protein
MDLGEVAWGDVNWIGLAQDRNSKYCYSFECLSVFLILRTGVFSRLPLPIVDVAIYLHWLELLRFVA